MRNIALSALLLGAGLSLAPPAHAQNDVGRIIQGVAEGLLQQEADRAAYIQAQNANTVEAYRAYLSRYPNGIYVGNARQALQRLGATATTPTRNSNQPVVDNRPTPTTPAATSAAQTEANIGLSRAQRVEIQRQLTRIGYDTRGADGLWGRLTRSAIGDWQKAHGHAVTGYVTQGQVQQIATQARAAGATPAASTQAGNARLEEGLLSLTTAERRELQMRLTLLGYDTRGADGVFGTNTRNAIGRWQGDHNEAVTGYLTADQVRELRAETRG